jgi:hypothetical protein
MVTVPSGSSWATVSSLSSERCRLFLIRQE